MRRFARFFAALLVALALTACGSAATSSAPAPAVVAAPQGLPRDIDVQTTAALQGRDDVVLLDVREQHEYDAGHIPGVVHIPMGEVASRLAEIPTDKTVIVTCRSGNRSGQITSLLQQKGYTNVHNMRGGILAWQQAGFSVER